ncbi:MAG TPA: peptidase M64 N-terminal domain-containing protein, partial [Vicinamibacterales bacterium]|nr:peptidase M64 N-terminal domain-containing protein [Vicinamibacterales bacterium]
MKAQATGCGLQATGRVGLGAFRPDAASSLRSAACSLALAAALVVAIAGVVPALAADPPRTLRLDIFHTGSATDERFGLDRLVLEPLPWPGNPERPADDTNFGKYLFQVIDRASNRVLYSRGFASIYGEWETTGEARQITRTFGESLRFPLPPAPVQVIVKKRDKQNAFREVWSTIVDPADVFIDRSQAPSPGPL